MIPYQIPMMMRMTMMKKKDPRKNSRIRNIEDMPRKDLLRSKIVFMAEDSLLYHSTSSQQLARRKASAR